MITDIVDDYSLRDLQIYSSNILSANEATNNFIKQFKADHDSHQFYKNVIIWFIKKYKVFPDDYLIFNFSSNSGGLGDRFMIISAILHALLEQKKNAVINLFYGHDKYFDLDSKYYRTEKQKLLPYKNFYEILDFFHFKKPTFKIITNPINKFISPENDILIPQFRLLRDTMANVTDCGRYWPIDFDETKEKKYISYIFYNFYGEHDLGTYKGDKALKSYEIQKFHQIVSKFLNLKFVELEEINYAKNVEILSRTRLLIATEGMWTHLSRAMNIPTIAFTKSEDFIREINQQGHFCSGNFEECLIKLIEKCTNLTK